MSCERIAELLPWWMNGTLDGEERQRVQDHLAECAACREELRQTRLAWSLHEGHPPAEWLVDHALGRNMAPDRSELLEHHLESCPRCTAELDLVRRNPEPSAAAIEDPLLAASGRRVARRRAVDWRAAALAAAVAALMLGGGWLQSARQQQKLITRIEELTAPRINVPVLELEPSSSQAVLRDSSGGPEGTVNEPEMSTTAGEVLLLLLSGGEACGDFCSVEILTTSGHPAVILEGLVPDQANHLSFTLPASQIPPQRFTLQVFDPARPDQALRYIVEIGSTSAAAPELTKRRDP